jgi:mRNA interferase RelE/StbE
LARTLSEAIAANSIFDNEAGEASLVLGQIQNGEFLILAPGQLQHALRASWERQIELRESVRIQEEERRKALNEAYAKGIRFSLAGVRGWKFVLSDDFTKCVQKVDKKLQGRVLEAITKLAEAPLTVVGDTVKPLTANLKGLWRYRVGDYRLVYDTNQDEEVVTLVSFEPRGDAY